MLIHKIHQCIGIGIEIGIERHSLFIKLLETSLSDWNVSDILCSFHLKCRTRHLFLMYSKSDMFISIFCSADTKLRIMSVPIRSSEQFNFSLQLYFNTTGSILI